jgi:hypothetical protein
MAARDHAQSPEDSVHSDHMTAAGRRRRGQDSTRVKPIDDDEYRATAQEIQRQRPDWMVLWGCYSRRFVAFPLFAMRRRVIVIASYPDALLARLAEIERVQRIQPEKEEGAPEGAGDDNARRNVQHGGYH